MTIRIPTQDKRLQQFGNSDVLGNVWGSFNLDLTSKKGTIRVSPRLYINTDDTTDLGVATNFVKLGSTGDANTGIYTIAGTYVFRNTASALQGNYIKDTTGSSPNTCEVEADLTLFNSKLYIVDGDDRLSRLDTSGNWANISNSLNGNARALLAYGDRLYLAHADALVASMNEAETVIESGSYTLDLTEFGGGKANRITKMLAGTNRIWILTQNQQKGRARIYEWDGVAENDPTRFYEIDSFAVLAGVIKEDIPYVMDADGVLRKYSGGAFIEVARLPVKDGTFLKNPLSSDPTNRFIHYNGMALVNGRIQMLINNENQDINGTIEHNLPSGIWEYDPDIGLYHKQAITHWVSGDSTATDYGQIRLSKVGGLVEFKNDDTSTGTNGQLLLGVEYYSDDTTVKQAICLDDTADTFPKMGYLISTWGESSSIKDSWKEFCVAHKKLLDSSDKIILKYRTNVEDPTEITVGWLGEQKFATTTDLSEMVGHEIEIIQGTGGAITRHIESVTGSGTYTVTLDESITGVTGQSIIRVTNFKKVATLTSQEDDIECKAFGVTAHRLQVKVEMYFTGKDEVHKIIVPSVVHSGTK